MTNDLHRRRMDVAGFGHEILYQKWFFIQINIFKSITNGVFLSATFQPWKFLGNLVL